MGLSKTDNINQMITILSLGFLICLDRDSQSRHWQRASLDSQENLDTFKKLVSTIEISWFSLDGHMQIQYFSVEIETYQDLLRLLWLFVIFVDFSGENSIFFEKVLTKILIISKNHCYLNLSWWYWLVSTISIKISTQPSLDWKVSILKISTEIK